MSGSEGCVNCAPVTEPHGVDPMCCCMCGDDEQHPPTHCGNGAALADIACSPHIVPGVPGIHDEPCTASGVVHTGVLPFLLHAT